MLLGQSNVVETLNIRDGLSQGFVSCVFQDREGFIWAGTKNGLNRYDGQQFKVFANDPFNPNTISNDYVLSISEYGDFLLLGTNGGGLNIFSKKTQRFYRLPDQLPGGEQQESPVVYKGFVDKQGDIWLHYWKEKAYLEGPVNHLRMPAGFWERLEHSDEPWAGISIARPFAEQYRQIHLSRDRQTLWLSSFQNIVWLDVQTGFLQTFQVQAKASNFSEDTDGNCWTLSLTGLLKLNRTGYQAISTDFPVGRTVSFDQNNSLLINIEGGGVLRFDSIDLTSARLRMAAAKLHIPGLLVDKVVTDHSGIAWFATLGYGMKKLNPRLGRFKNYFAGSSIYSPPFTGSEGILGVLSFADGLHLVPANSRHPLAAFWKTHADYGVYTRYIRDCAGRHWVYYYRKEEYHLMQLSEEGQVLRDFFINKSSEPGGVITLDEQCIFWIAHNGYFVRFDPQTAQLRWFPYNNILPLGHEVRSVVRTPNRHWWLATEFGLVEVVPDGEQFRFVLYKNIPGDRSSLRNENLAALLLDPKDPNLIWVATKGGGLERLDIRTKKFAHLTSREGLPNEVIYGILDDAAGNLWLSSNRGLIRYSPGSGSIKNFTEADGLLSNEFNTWAYGKTASGELVFGSVNGLHVFNPADWQENLVLPKVYITGLKVNNRAVEPGDSTGLLRLATEWTTEITLPFDQNSLALEFAALEFSAPAQNRFRYYLEGAEPQWAHEGFEHTAQYLNLQPGKYTFKVMACNNDGHWNPAPATLRVVVLPPWYRSPAAWLFYALAAGGLLAGYLRFRLHRLQLQQQLALEHLEAKRLKELDEFKSRFFTNISHEFRTPLTVILGMTEQLSSSNLPEAVAEGSSSGSSSSSLQEAEGSSSSSSSLQEAVAEGSSCSSLQEAEGVLSLPPATATATAPATAPATAISLIKRNGENLLRLVNQILDLAKLESHTLHLNYTQGDVLAYLKYVAESLHSLVNTKNITLRVESNASAIVMDYDPERLLQMVYNLLSNAIKFTPLGGQVVLRAELLPDVADAGAAMLHLTVSDNGVGIPAKDLPFLFDRFFQASNPHHAHLSGSGIGLALTSELAKAMGGSIAVESVEGQGSTFRVSLPVHRDAPMDPGPNSFFRPWGPPEPIAPPRPPDATWPVLLIVEDNPDVVEYLSACLAKDYQLEYAYNGQAGIEKALELIPDIIISDVMMPEKDGFEVCDTLKHDERSSHIPLVLLTARAAVEDRIAGLRRGADAFLAKPFHPVELQVVLANLLELRRQLQARYSLSAPRPEHSAALPADPEDAFLQKLQAVVESRLAQADLSVEEISRLLGMSYPVVHRKVTALTGRSLTLYVRLLRLLQARLLLANPALSIADVAYETGFNDPKFFSRVFSEEFGMSPTAFRQRTSD